GVEVAERLVEEAEPGPPHQGAAERHPLALAAGELARAPLEEAVELQADGDLADAVVDLVAGKAGDLEGEGDVAAHVEVRVERVALEDHGHPPIAGGLLVDHL